MDIKKISRLRRAKRSRIKMRELGAIRLTVFRTSRHTYAQVLNSSGDQVLAEASTLDESIRDGSTSNVEAAKQVGGLVAERAKAKGVKRVAFERSGYRYHGRVRALAEAAREAGLEF